MLIQVLNQLRSICVLFVWQRDGPNLNMMDFVAFVFEKFLSLKFAEKQKQHANINISSANTKRIYV